MTDQGESPSLPEIANHLGASLRRLTYAFERLKQATRPLAETALRLASLSAPALLSPLPATISNEAGHLTPALKTPGWQAAMAQLSGAAQALRPVTTAALAPMAVPAHSILAREANPAASLHSTGGDVASRERRAAFRPTAKTEQEIPPRVALASASAQIASLGRLGLSTARQGLLAKALEQPGLVPAAQAAMPSSAAMPLRAEMASAWQQTLALGGDLGALEAIYRAGRWAGPKLSALEPALAQLLRGLGRIGRIPEGVARTTSAAVAGIGAAWEAVTVAASTAWKTTMGAISRAVAGIGTAWEAVTVAASTAWKTTMGAISCAVAGIETAWEAVTVAASTAWEAMGGPAVLVAAGLAAAGLAAYELCKHWDKVRERLAEFGHWVFGWARALDATMLNAGAALISSLAEGVRSKLAAVGHAMHTVARAMMAYLPRSPAERGPLRELHHVRIVETIAQGIRTGPLLAALGRVASVAALAAPALLAPALAPAALAGIAADRRARAPVGVTNSFTVHVHVEAGTPVSRADADEIGQRVAAAMRAHLTELEDATAAAVERALARNGRKELK